MLRRMMRLLRETPRDRDRAALDRFVEAQSAYVAQRMTIGYCEIKAGPLRHSLFREAGFQVLLERSRWEAFAAVRADAVAAQIELDKLQRAQRERERRRPDRRQSVPARQPEF